MRCMQALEWLVDDCRASHKHWPIVSQQTSRLLQTIQADTFKTKLYEVTFSEIINICHARVIVGKWWRAQWSRQTLQRLRWMGAIADMKIFCRSWEQHAAGRTYAQGNSIIRHSKTSTSESKICCRSIMLLSALIQMSQILIAGVETKKCSDYFTSSWAPWNAQKIS